MAYSSWLAFAGLACLASGMTAGLRSGEKRSQVDRLICKPVARSTALIPKKGLWEELPDDTAALRRSLDGRSASQARAFRLNTSLLCQQLASGKSLKRYAEIDCPVNDEPERFRVWPSRLLPKGLASKYQIETYVGQGAKDPTAIIRLERYNTGSGSRFHFMVLSPRGSLFIDPESGHSAETRYIALPRGREQRQRIQNWKCRRAIDPAGVPDTSWTGNLPEHYSSDGKQRTYRIAVAATSDYIRARGGSERAFESLITTFNRVAGIFQRDLAIHLEFVPAQEKLLISDPEKDPFRDRRFSDLPWCNQHFLDKYVGHLLCIEDGGIAEIGFVGSPQMKARGVTGLPWTETCAADVDLVAHELGHQFGAHHTNNSMLGSAGLASRYAPTAVEPGSGSTLMGIPGECGADDLQAHRDQYFHAVSLCEMSNFIRYVSKGSESPLRLPPAISTTAVGAVPQGTPFYLSAMPLEPINPARSGWTYTWEQVDQGAPSPPEEDDQSRPLFRSELPKICGDRFFPSLESVFASRLRKGETLGSTSRKLHFRVTARDNRAEGGTFTSRMVSIAQTAEAGPFLVREPQAGKVWKAGSYQTVIWDAARTNCPPVGCRMVRIELSSDNGKTFRKVASNVPNLGATTVKLPVDAATQAARIRVSAEDGSFYQVSPLAFVIE